MPLQASRVTLKAGNRPKYWKIFINREGYSGTLFVTKCEEKQTPLCIFSESFSRILSSLRAKLCYHWEIKPFARCTPCHGAVSDFVILTVILIVTLADMCLLQLYFLSIFFEGLRGGELNFWSFSCLSSMNGGFMGMCFCVWFMLVSDH